MNEHNIQRLQFDFIKDNLSIFEVARFFGVDLNLDDGIEQQVSCFFHGDDERPSARLYPDGYFHCFACEPPLNHLDVIGFIKYAADLSSFKDVIPYVAEHFDLNVPSFEEEAGNVFFSVSGQVSKTANKGVEKVPSWQIHRDIESYIIGLEPSFEEAKVMYKRLDNWLEACPNIEFPPRAAKHIRESFLDWARKLTV